MKSNSKFVSPTCLILLYLIFVHVFLIKVCIFQIFRKYSNNQIKNRFSPKLQIKYMYMTITQIADNQDGLVVLPHKDVRLGGHGLLRSSKKAAASVVPSRLSSHRHDFRYLGSHQISTWRPHYFFR